jgi:hypothetical protein
MTRPDPAQGPFVLATPGSCRRRRPYLCTWIPVGVQVIERGEAKVIPPGLRLAGAY